MSNCVLDNRQPNNERHYLRALTPRRVKSSLQYPARSSVFHHVHHVLGSPSLSSVSRRPRVTSILRLQLPAHGRLHVLVKRVSFLPSHASGSHELLCLSGSCIGINGSGSLRRKCCQGEAHGKSESIEKSRSTHDQQVATRDLGSLACEDRGYFGTTTHLHWVPVRLQVMNNLGPCY